MSNQKATLTELSVEDINAKVAEITLQISHLSFLPADKVKERSAMRGLRQDRARLLTALQQKEAN